MIDDRIQKLTAKAERIEAPADRVDFAQAAIAAATSRWARRAPGGYGSP